jgi:hypothetical protein
MISLSTLLGGRIPIESSNLASVGFDSFTNVLEIEFHGGRIYEYYNVPFSIYAGLMAAESHGKYFARHIRDKYRFRRIH